MAILIDKNTKVLIQGITGNEGSRACEEILKAGTSVLAGVTPGKGGQSVHNVPVYNSVAEAYSQHPEINTTLIAVPAKFAKAAALEAIESKINLINILTEHIPVFDCAYIVSAAKANGVTILGPSSIGILSPGLGKIGSIGSGETAKVFTPGPVGIISKSGGMTSEISSLLTQNGIGQSTVLGIGGDQIIGSDFVDILKLFEKDDQTKAIVMFGEIGGTYEELAAEFISSGKFTKPVVAIIAGKFTENLPDETVLGHAGAIVSRGRGSYESKVSALKKAGVEVVDTLSEIPVIIKKLL